VTKEIFPKTWPVFDRPGFDLVQQSMINFGRHVFSKLNFSLSIELDL
jgi:hypothetical protein